MVEVSYEVAAADKFGEHILIQYRHGAAENAQFSRKTAIREGGRTISPILIDGERVLEKVLM